MPGKHGQVCWVNMQINNELREKNERWRGLSAASGEKDPAKHLVTVARCYSKEILAGGIKTISAQQNVDGPQEVIREHSRQDAQNVRPARPQPMKAPEA